MSVEEEKSRKMLLTSVSLLLGGLLHCTKDSVTRKDVITLDCFILYDVPITRTHSFTFTHVLALIFILL